MSSSEEESRGPAGKTGRAVVVPGDVEIQRAVDGTEILGDDSLPRKPSDVEVESIATPSRRVVFTYRLGTIITVVLSIVAFVLWWCNFFAKPKTIEKRWVRVNGLTRNQVRNWVYGWELLLSLPRALLSNVVTAVVSMIMAVFYLNNQLQPKRTKIGKALEWALKCGLPYILCLPLVGLAIQEQPMDIRVVMGDKDLGVYDTMRALAVRGTDVSFGSGSLARTATISTILRSVLLPPRNQLRQCNIAESQSANEFTGVAYEFLANEWQKSVLPNGTTPSETYVVPGSRRASPVETTKTRFTLKEAALVESLFTRGVYLYADAVLTRDSDLRGSNAAALKQLKLDTIAYSNRSSISDLTTTRPNDHVTAYVRSFFSNTSSWESLLRANISDITVDYAKFKISEDIAFMSVNNDIPLQSAIWHRKLTELNGELVESINSAWSGTGPVEYEFDVVNECGPNTCGIQNRGLSPDPKVVAFAVCPSDGSDCGYTTMLDSMWLFGFARRIEGDRFEVLDPPSNPNFRKAVVTNPREYHRISMGLLKFNLTDLSKRFHARCRA